MSLRCESSSPSQASLPLCYNVVMAAKELDPAVLRRELRYHPETGLFHRLTKRGGCPIGTVAGNINSLGYCELNVCGVRILAHRAAWLYVHGKLPDKTIDHIDRNRSNNRIANLRDVDQSVNSFNTGLRVDNTTGYKGVYWHGPAKKWMVAVRREGRQVHIGLYATKEEAIEARVAATQC